MTDLQLETLQSHLKRAVRDPAEYQMEVLTQALKVHAGLYKQEGDKEGMNIYLPLLKLVEEAGSIKKVEELVQGAMTSRNN
jgi:hypothetical protein